jgi:hypothetical protein
MVTKRLLWLSLARACKLTIIIAAFPGFVAAQQTIINVPSDARTPQGLGFVLHESAISTRTNNAGSYSSTNFLTYGWTPVTELCATLYQASSDGSPDLALGLGFKSTWEVWKERFPDLHTRFTLGHMTPISLGNQSQAVGFFTYSSVSFDIPRTPFRLLGGAAGGSSNIWGRSTGSAIMGLELPMTDHLSFTGEWFSGDHHFSGLIPGFTYHRDSMIVVAGYKMSNDFDPKKEGLVLEVGWFFGGSRKSRLEKLEAEEDEPHYGVFGLRQRAGRQGFPGGR